MLNLYFNEKMGLLGIAVFFSEPSAYGQIAKDLPCVWCAFISTTFSLRTS